MGGSTLNPTQMCTWTWLEVVAASWRFRPPMQVEHQFKELLQIDN